MTANIDDEDSDTYDMPEVRLEVTPSSGLCLEIGFKYRNDTDMLLQTSRMLGTPEGIDPALTLVVPDELKHLIAPREEAV